MPFIATFLYFFEEDLRQLIHSMSTWMKITLEFQTTTLTIYSSIGIDGSRSNEL